MSPAFTDSVDATGLYPTGICGEKIFSFAASVPDFMILTLGADPILDQFRIDYDHTQTTILDVVPGGYTIGYEVDWAEYSSYNFWLTGGFHLDVQCTATEDAGYIGGTTNFNLLADSTVLIPMPTISNAPSTCFGIQWFARRSSDNADLVVTLPAVFSIASGATDMTVAHTISDYALR